MSQELIVPQPENESQQPWWKLINPQAIARLIQERFGHPTPTEIRLSNEELIERVETLYFLVKTKGEINLRLGKRKYCRISAHPNKYDTLEIRVGSNSDSVKAERFYGLMKLDTIIQITFLPKGTLFEAVRADQEDLIKQSETLLGADEYNFSGVLNGLKYMPYVTAVGSFTANNASEIPVPQQVHEQILQEVFAPAQGIIWRLTENEPARQWVRETNTKIY